MKDHPEYFIDDFHLSGKGGREFARILVEGLRDHALLPRETSTPLARNESTD